MQLSIATVILAIGTIDSCWAGRRSGHTLHKKNGLGFKFGGVRPSRMKGSEYSLTLQCRSKTPLGATSCVCTWPYFELDLIWPSWICTFLTWTLLNFRKMVTHLSTSLKLFFHILFSWAWIRIWISDWNSEKVHPSTSLKLFFSYFL